MNKFYPYINITCKKTFPLNYSGCDTINENVCYKHNFTDDCDIIESITIHNILIKEIFINIGGKVVWYNSYKDAHSLTIKPFDFGIPIMALKYQQVTLIVIGNEKHFHPSPRYSSYSGILLDKKEKNILCDNILSFDQVTIKDGMWYQENYPYESNIDTALKFDYVLPASNDYICNYPKDPNANNIVGVKEYTVRQFSKELNSNVYKFDISNIGDIIKSFDIIGHWIECKIVIGGSTVSHHYKHESKYIYPFSGFGIPLLCLQYHHVVVFITAPSNPKLFSRVVEIKQKDIERLCKSSIEFKVTSSFRIEHGMMGKGFDQLLSK